MLVTNFICNYSRRIQFLRRFTLDLALNTLFLAVFKLVFYHFPHAFCSTLRSVVLCFLPLLNGGQKNYIPKYHAPCNRDNYQFLLAYLTYPSARCFCSPRIFRRFGELWISYPEYNLPPLKSYLQSLFSPWHLLLYKLIFIGNDLCHKN